MASKSVITLIGAVVLIVVAAAIIWSIWSSLQETRAKLAAQQQKMEEIEHRDASLNRYIDSLEVALSFLTEREVKLTEERDNFIRELAVINLKYDEAFARIDRLWEATDINRTLGNAFPHWKDQFYEARRADGVHAIIVPQMFGPEVLEINSELGRSEDALKNKDQQIVNLEDRVNVKDQKIDIVRLQRDSTIAEYQSPFEISIHWASHHP